LLRQREFWSLRHEDDCKKHGARKVSAFEQVYKHVLLSRGPFVERLVLKPMPCQISQKLRVTHLGFCKTESKYAKHGSGSVVA
jgi:hypothetical protein